MIIPCRQCHTRFKVPDGKVRARGLKVRCSRCGHTFRIYPDSGAEGGAEPVPAAARPRGPDPFEPFGPDGTSELEKTPSRGTTVSALLSQMAPPAGEDFDVDVAGVEAASTEPAWNFPPAPTRPASSGAAVALQVQPDEALPSTDLAPARSPVPVRPLPSPAEPELADPAPIPVQPLPPVRESGLAGLFEDEPADAAPPIGVQPPAMSPPSALSAPPAGEDLTAPAGFAPARGHAAPSRALSADGTLSANTSSLSPLAEPPAPPPPPQFGGAGTVLDDLPSLEPSAVAEYGGIELDAGSGARDWNGMAALALGGNQIDFEPDLPSMELDRRPPPELAPAPAMDPPWTLAPATPLSAAAAAPPAEPSWGLPAAPSAPAPAAAAPALGWDDPFSEPPAPPRPVPPSPPEPVAAPRSTAPNAVVLDEAPPSAIGRRAPDHELFEMPGRSSAPERSPGLLPDVPEAVEPPPTPSLSVTTSGPLPAIFKPPSRVRLGLRETELPGTARQISAVILNVGLAALLLLVTVGVVSSWATAGRVDGAALSPRRLLDALRPGSGVAPVEVTSGTYETRSGRALLYVRGRVLNRGAPPSRVRVRAEIWEGAQAVKTGETLAGSIATPEELWRATTPADVEALRARLLKAATAVKDGQQADFLVLLDEAPRDLSGLRLKVTATAER